jgi:hypothetical protein
VLVAILCKDCKCEAVHTEELLNVPDMLPNVLVCCLEKMQNMGSDAEFLIENLLKTPDWKTRKRRD